MKAFELLRDVLHYLSRRLGVSGTSLQHTLTDVEVHLEDCLIKRALRNQLEKVPPESDDREQFSSRCLALLALMCVS